MKKIFHIISNKEWGGGEQYVYDLCTQQLNDGIKIELFCRPTANIIQKFHKLNIPIHCLPLKGATDIISAYKMAKIVKNNDCIIHAHNFKDAFTASYARLLSGNLLIKIVMCRHLTRKGKTSWIYNWLYKQLDAICFVSDISKETFLSTNPNIDSKKINVIHTSIVVPKVVVPKPIRSEYEIPNDHILAMYHGRLDQEKGLDILVDAVSKIKEIPFKLFLIGKGSEAYTAHLKQLVNTYGLNNKIIFAGFCHPVLPYLINSDFGILPSIVSEACPLSPQEYMSQGRAVIATDNGGQREYIINGYNGLLVPPADSSKLAECIKLMVTNIELRRKLGQQALNDYNTSLNYDNFYKQMKQFYDTVL